MRASPHATQTTRFSHAFRRKADRSKLRAGADRPPCRTLARRRCRRGRARPLAGPVVAAAVILDPERIPQGLNDSKQLSAARREALFIEILATATVSIASSSATRIDVTDIRKASLDAMRRAICGLAIPASYVLTDGLDVPAGLACPGKAVVKGDARSFSIAAASIVAKVTRDRMMARAGDVFPAYGFAAHAGYGTAQHRAGIEKHGPCSLHRMSFRPLRRDEA